MMRLRFAGMLLILCLLAVALRQSAFAAAPQAEPRSKFIRLERDKAGELVALQTAVVQFVPVGDAMPGVTVALIGAVHVGEKAYYEALNERFKDYDVVLYELVAPSGTKIPKGTKPGNHPVAMLQNGLKDMLALEHQLQYVDYTPDNMVHADMSPDEMAKSMKDRDESFVTMFFRMMGHAMAQQSTQEQQGKSSELDLFAALFDKDRAGSMKRLLAEQFENVEGAMSALEGPKGSTIISERNKVALAKLSEQIAAGKKKIAIFYGAGHLNDMEKHLGADFHLKRGSEEWLTAWNLAKSPAAPKAPAAAAP